ncbi:MAG: type I methionyl aminopeptidase [Candidatus Neomarinimicrobiota bacterium]|nr:MAG: type I methionyl aminopeptidase [Candidatus Neomarinimicrobiota bacterium]
MVRVRTRREIELIAESAQIVADTLDMLSTKVTSGVSLLELDAQAEEFIRSRNARPAFKGYMGFPATLCISVDDEVVHGIPSNSKLSEGQIVGIDCGAEKNGYYGDSARTFAVGNISDNNRDLMLTTEKALALGIEQAKPGNHVSDIGHAIQSFVEPKGFSIVRELVGHGIGTQLHEDPQVPNYGVPGMGGELKEGMCLAIEPMINCGRKEVYTAEDGWTIKTKDGYNSAHFEHTIAILENGAEILSRSQLNG